MGSSEERLISIAVGIVLLLCIVKCSTEDEVISRTRCRYAVNGPRFVPLHLRVGCAYRAITIDKWPLVYILTRIH